MADGKKWPFFFSAHNSELNTRVELEPSAESPVNQPSPNEKIPITWSPMNELVWANGRQILQCLDEKEQLDLATDDISLKMRKRALADYGFDEKYKPEEKHLRNVWRWLRKSKNLEKVLKVTAKNRVYGVNQVFRFKGMNTYLKAILNSTLSKSDCESTEWYGLDPNHLARMNIYRSEERQRALLLCEWGGSGFCQEELDDQILEDDYPKLGVYNLIDELESCGEYTRAAALAVFNLNLKRAIDLLSKCANLPRDRGGDAHLGAVAMALSGFTGNMSNYLWQDMCASLKNRFRDPYLKCIFYFLTCDKDTHYEELLYDIQLLLSDRVAFALCFLPDDRLEEYLRKITEQAIETGDIEGLLLVGMSANGIRLLQSYVDRTSDVQTASLIIAHALPNVNCEHESARNWVSIYKDFLDRQRLWHLTAKFNIHWHAIIPDVPIESADPIPPQVYVSCNICHCNVSSYLQLFGGPSEAYKGKGNSESSNPQPPQPHCGRVSVSAACQKTRVQACPRCRRPLPRCALCCTHLGTSSSVYFRGGSTQVEDARLAEQATRKLSPFGSWFSWCQTCRHGGHARHVLDWFSRNLECPVSGCTCKCMSIDSAAKLKVSNDI